MNPDDSAPAPYAQFCLDVHRRQHLRPAVELLVPTDGDPRGQLLSIDLFDSDNFDDDELFRD